MKRAFVLPLFVAISLILINQVAAVNLIRDGRDLAEDIGDVTVTSSGSITFSTSVAADGSGWLLEETHLHVCDALGEIPGGKGGNPKVGKFDYNDEHDPAVNTFTYNVSFADVDTDGDGVVIIAAHAAIGLYENVGGVLVPVMEEVTLPDGTIVLVPVTDSAWAEGTPFAKSWAMYFVYNYTE